MKHGLLSWSHCPSLHSTFISPPFSTAVKLKFPKPRFPTIAVTLSSVEESPMTARERRQLRNERRESKPAYNWKEEVETKLLEKPKKRFSSWKDELNLDNLALPGPQWWTVKAASAAAQETAERLARLMARDFPSMEFKVYVPSVQIKRKLKSGEISVKAKQLFPGSIFLRCVMNKELHDFIRKVYGVRGFRGVMVGNTKRKIMKPKPVNEQDMEAIFKQAKEEQEKANQAFEENQQKDEDLVSQDLTKNNATKKPRGRKAANQPIIGKATALKPGSTVVIVSGLFAGYSGTLKKLDRKTGLATVGFTVFGKETLADIAADEILAETK